MSDYDSLTLGLLMLARLRTHWLTRRELAADLDVHERTVRRMIDAIRAAEVAIDQRRRGGGLEIEYRAGR